jgi:phospholipid transport system substrate-binding protein
MKRMHIIGLIASLLIFLPCVVHAVTPLETIQSNVDKVLEILGNKDLKTEVKKERLEVIYKVMFDEEELSKLSLGRNWNQLNASQKQEFVGLFRSILEDAYADKIMSYTDEKVEYYRERTLSENRVEVQTRLITSSKTVPVFYRLILNGGVWRVYDVAVENVSLVQNYRAQFRDILADKTPDQLIETLRKKSKEK